MAVWSFSLLAGLLAVASASPCKPSAYVLPSTGTGTELPAAGSDVRLLKIAIGHGIQNYSCASSSATVAATGALAVLYDVTALYPGTRGTGLAPDAFNALTAAVLWGQDLPLNLATASAASPGTPASPNVCAESEYGAVVASPFPAPGALSVAGVPTAPFLGHHYFDAAGIPTFDLAAAGLFGSMKKTGNVPAPPTAASGILGTGAVDWLQLGPNANGLSRGVKLVYRVVTAGGVSHTCDVLGAAAGSVPYTAFYWFYG